MPEIMVLFGYDCMVQNNSTPMKIFHLLHFQCMEKSVWETISINRNTCGFDGGFFLIIEGYIPLMNLC